MTDAQFAAICKLMRGNRESQANLAAWAVLVEDKTQADAMRATGATRSSVHDAVKRFSAAHELILEAYGSQKARERR